MNKRKLQKVVIDKTFFTGIKRYDGVTKYFVGVINNLGDAMMGKKTEEILTNTFRELFQFDQKHLIREELELVKHGYSDCNSHLNKHKEFIFEIRWLYLQNKSGNGDSRTLAAEIVAILTEWIQIHIVGDDSACASFLRSKGVSLA